MLITSELKKKKRKKSPDKESRSNNKKYIAGRLLGGDPN